MHNFISNKYTKWYFNIISAAKCSITGEILGRISQDDPRWLTGQIVGVRKS